MRRRLLPQRRLGARRLAVSLQLCGGWARCLQRAQRLAHAAQASLQLPSLPALLTVLQHLSQRLHILQEGRASLLCRG